MSGFIKGNMKRPSRASGEAFQPGITADLGAMPIWAESRDTSYS